MTPKTNYAASKERNDQIIADALKYLNTMEKTAEIETLILIFKGDRSGYRSVNLNLVYQIAPRISKAYKIMKNRLKPWKYFNDEKKITRKRDYSPFRKKRHFDRLEEQLKVVGIIDHDYKFINKRGNKGIMIMLIKMIVDYKLCNEEFNYIRLMEHFMVQYDMPELKRIYHPLPERENSILAHFYWLQNRKSDMLITKIHKTQLIH